MAEREKVLIEIESCSQCKHRLVERVYTGDSFECVVKWLCHKADRKDNVICGYLEWHDKDPQVPSWCPLRVKSKK